MESNERFTVGETVRSCIDLGKLAVATLLERIDTHFADRINGGDDEIV